MVDVEDVLLSILLKALPLVLHAVNTSKKVANRAVLCLCVTAAFTINTMVHLLWSYFGCISVCIIINSAEHLVSILLFSLFQLFYFFSARLRLFSSQTVVNRLRSRPNGVSGCRIGFIFVLAIGLHSDNKLKKLLHGSVRLAHRRHTTG